jgi:hypothetical protein
MSWLIDRYQTMARALAWIGVVAIVALSVVPAADSPVTGAGQSVEHFSAFALVAGMFAVGYRLSLARRLFFAILFCAGIELLQTPLPTRHARMSDFIIDVIASWVAIAVVFSSEIITVRRESITNVDRRS